MNISLGWLGDFIKVPKSVPELSDTLTMMGLEVESIDDQAQTYTGFFIGEVTERQKHPNADRLSVCRVNVGQEPIQIVCGAPNVAAGQKVAVGLVGAVVPHDQHDPNGQPFKLQRTKIRGVESFGMICSAFELGIGEDRDGIIVFDPTAVPGTPLSEYLKKTDTILSIGITPNRPDCLGHIGVARDIAAFYKLDLRLPDIRLKESPTESQKKFSVEIRDPEGCPRYSARLIEHVTPKESPPWIRARLESVGIRPINSVVDATNYVLMEVGHPLHAFDYDMIQDSRIIVRSASDGEMFVTLDGKEHKLLSSDVVIADGKRAIALAGIMGGLNSEITERTHTVILESAYFSPKHIRRTAKRLGISTEASHRFERGADPERTVQALDRAASLIAEFSGGEIAKGIIDQYPSKIHPRMIRFRPVRASMILGIEISNEEAIGILRRLGCIVSDPSQGGGVFEVYTPTFRPDLEREIDLIEEIARIHGYREIPEQHSAYVSFTGVQRNSGIEDTLKNYCSNRGFHEAYCNSMVDERFARLMDVEPVSLLNPLSRDMSVIRTSLIPGLLQAVCLNLNNGMKSVRLFEIGTVARKSTDDRLEPVPGYHEERRLAMVMAGTAELASVWQAERPFDLFDIKGEVESLFSMLKLDKVEVVYYSSYGKLLQSTIQYASGKEPVGVVGESSRELLSMAGLDDFVFVAELSVSPMEEASGKRKKYSELPKYPAVFRDLAVIVDESVPAGAIVEKVRRAGVPELRSVAMFDVYRGKPLPEDKKSVAVSIEFRSDSQTLQEEQIGMMMKKVTDAVTNAGWELRIAGVE